MLTLAHHVTTVVRSIRRETDRILAYELADPDDWILPPFSPGAHIDVHLRKGLTRPYSLCGSPSLDNRYWIAVQREPNGRGGSVALQEMLKIGSTVSVSLPRNNFPLDRRAGYYKFIAGGIGITPIIPMLEELTLRSSDFELHYCTREPEQTAFRNWITNSPIRERTTFYHSRITRPNTLNVSKLLEHYHAGEHIYCCGPRGLVETVLEKSEAAERDSSTIHVELFGNGASASAGSEVAFTVGLAKSNKIIEVAAGETILEALRRADVEIDASCEAGACLSCKTRYLEGSPIHRDLLMGTKERQQFMTPCVSGCSSPHLVLEL